MVKVEKAYMFDGPEGKASLKELFGNHRQLIVYHFMFDPAWDKGCPGCTGYVDALGDLSALNERDTNFVLVMPTNSFPIQVDAAAVQEVHGPYQTSVGM